MIQNILARCIQEYVKFIIGWHVCQWGPPEAAKPLINAAVIVENDNNTLYRICDVALIVNATTSANKTGIQLGAVW